MTINIESMPLRTAPPGFTGALTGQGEPVRWEILEDASAPGGRVISEPSQDSADYRFALCIFNGFTACDVEASVRFKAVVPVERMIGPRSFFQLPVRKNHLLACGPSADAGRIRLSSQNAKQTVLD